MDHQLIAVFFLYLFPGRDDENIIDVELVEILLPVVDPVHILRLGFLDHARSYIQISAHLIQFLPYVQKDRSFILFFVQIEGQISRAVIFRNIWQDVHEHLLLIFLRKRHLVLDLHALDSQIHQHAADDVLRLRRRL